MKRLYRLGLIGTLLILLGCGEDGRQSPPPASGFTPVSSLPAAPSGVSATAGDRAVTIRWDPVGEAESYNIYMASASGVTKENAASLPDGMKHAGVVSPYNYTGLSNGKGSFFVVTALNADGESAASAEVAATPAPRPITLDAGNDHTCALLSDDTVKCWGSNAYGQLGDGTTDDSTGPVLVAGMTDASAIAIGQDHSCALLVSGQLGNGSTTNRFTPAAVAGLSALAVSTGGAHTCALLTTGGVACWGDSSSGKLGRASATPLTVPE